MALPTRALNRASRTSPRTAAAGWSRLILAVVLASFASLAWADETDEESELVRRRLAGLHAASGTTLPPLDPASWTEEQIKRIRRLESYYVCACAKENYTKTLEGCPDACADEQKTLIRNSVREEKSDIQIKRLMVDRYTARVIGRVSWSGDGKWSYIVPITVIFLSFVVGFFVLRSWRRSGQAAKKVRHEENQWVEDDALDQVRRELDRIE